MQQNVAADPNCYTDAPSGRRTVVRFGNGRSLASNADPSAHRGRGIEPYAWIHTLFDFHAGSPDIETQVWGEIPSVNHSETREDRRIAGLYRDHQKEAKGQNRAAIDRNFSK